MGSVSYSLRQSDFGLVLDSTAGSDEAIVCFDANDGADHPEKEVYPYVSSKNREVFHKSDCSSAKRIKGENLVKYKNPAGGDRRREKAL